MKRVSKKDKFAKKMVKLLQKQGAIVEGDNDYSTSLAMDTVCGKWVLHVDKMPSRVYTVCTRFKDVELAKQMIGASTRLNPYSGKYNFHCDDENEIIKMVMNAVTNFKVG